MSETEETTTIPEEERERPPHVVDPDPNIDVDPDLNPDLDPDPNAPPREREEEPATPETTEE